MLFCVRDCCVIACKVERIYVLTIIKRIIISSIIIFNFMPWYFIPRVLKLAKAKMYVRNDCDGDSETVIVIIRNVPGSIFLNPAETGCRRISVGVSGRNRNRIV